MPTKQLTGRTRFKLLPTGIGQLQFLLVVTNAEDRIRTLQFRTGVVLQANAGFRPSELALLKIAMFSFAIVDQVWCGVVV